MTEGIVTEIERYAVHDGPGIRTLIFLKGCPLRCQWCANPEAQKQKPEIYYDLNQCSLCLKCVEVCSQGAIFFNENLGIVETDRDKCNACGKCIRYCPRAARKIAGEYMTDEEVFDTIARDISFYRESNGGVTISGGEVLQQYDFAASILKRCQEEFIHTALETTGYGNFENLKLLLPYTDLLLYDIKHMDGEQHRQWTGADNEIILNNLRRIKKEWEKRVIIRIPLIAGINDNLENMLRTRNLALELDINEIHILPYHRLGRQKYQKLERKYKGEEFAKPDKEKIEKIRSLFQDAGLIVFINGSQ